MGQKWGKKTLKMAHVQKCLLSIIAIVYQIEKLKKYKFWSPQMIKVCQKNSTFQKKKCIFGHFHVLAKITKMAKKPFFILKSGNFFGTP